MNKFTTGSDNIFADLGLSEPAERAYKSDLAIAIARDIESRGWKQQEAAEVLGISQPKLSKLLSGKLDGISASKLFECLLRLGKDIEISIHPAQESRPGRVQVLTEAPEHA